jgi:hypothetical protein
MGAAANVACAIMDTADPVRVFQPDLAQFPIYAEYE